MCWPHAKRVFCLGSSIISCGEREAQRGLQQEGAVSGGKSLRLLPLSKLKWRPVRKLPLHASPGPDRWVPPLPACPVPTPSQPQGSLCKPFSSACPADLPRPHGSLELDKILYDPTLGYALLKAPVLASAGASARPGLGASSPPHTPLTPPPPLRAGGGPTAATPPPPPPLTEQGPQPGCPVHETEGKPAGQGRLGHLERER